VRRRPKAGALERLRGYRPSGVAWAAGGLGLVTFVVTILVMSMVFGGDGGGVNARAPQTAAQCDPSACAAESPSAPYASGEPLVRQRGLQKGPSASPTSTSPSPSATSPSSAPSSSSEPSSAPSRPQPERTLARAPVAPEPPRTDGRVTVRYATANAWQGTFHGTYVVVNNTDSDLPSWRLTFTYPPRKLTALWPQDWRRYGYTIVVNGGALPRGASTTIFFQGSGSPMRPSNCTFNGTACTPG